MTGYRIFRVCSSGIYGDLYRTFYKKQHLDQLLYKQAIDAFRQQGFLYPSGFQNAMAKFGNEVFEALVDFEPLQQQWMREQNATNKHISFSQENMFIRQIRAVKPDVIYFQEIDVVSRSLRVRLREMFSYLKIITAFKGFPPPVFGGYSDLDFVFVSYPYFQEQWQKVGVATHFLPHCFDPGTAPLPSTSKQYDFTFLGSSGYGNSQQEGRYRDLQRLLESTNLQIWSLEPEVSRSKQYMRWLALSTMSILPRSLLLYTHHQAEKASTNVAKLLRDALLVQGKSMKPDEWYLKERPLRELFPDRAHSPLGGRAYLDILGQSRVTLNRHTDKRGEDGNIRTFEATGMGACLLTDERPQLSQLFEPDREIVTYRTIDDCLAKLDYLLRNPIEREAIAARAQARVKQEHTTPHRCTVIHEVVSAALGRQPNSYRL